MPSSLRSGTVVLLSLPACVAWSLAHGRPAIRVLPAIAHSQRSPCRILAADTFNATAMFEGAVRSVSGNQDYKFGDLTKGAVSGAGNAVEGAVRSVSGNEDYKFGDITKGAVSEAGKAADNVAKSLTGKEASEYKFGDITKSALGNLAGKAGDDYQFGDVTKKILGDADAAVSDARDAYFNDLPMALWNRVFGGLSEGQRVDVFIAICQLGAVALLSYSLILNLHVGALTTAAWTLCLSRTGLSPLVAGQWSSFLSTYQTLRIALEAPLLVPRVFFAALLVPRYRRWTIRLQRKLPLRESHPILNRLLTLFTLWLVVNVLGVACVTMAGVFAGGLLAGVPAFAA